MLNSEASDSAPSAPITTVLFDFDDTLVSTYAARLNALQRVFTEAGVADPTAEAFLRDIRGRQFEDALLPLEEREGLPPLHLFKGYRDTYWKTSASAARLFPGVRALLEELRRRGLKLGIVTQKGWVFEVDGRAVGASMELAETGAGDLFSVGIGVESVTNYKPHPEGVLLALERLGERPEQAVVVGDTPADIAAGKAAGCWSVHATWGVPEANRSHLQTDADFVIDAPDELLRLPIFQ